MTSILQTSSTKRKDNRAHFVNTILKLLRFSGHQKCGLTDGMTDVDPSPIFILGTNTTRDVRAIWGHRGVNLY